MPTLAPGRRAAVRVPATSANLGPGFDALGLCLAWYDDVAVEVRDGGLSFDVAGEGAQDTPRDESHVIISALRTTLAALDADAPGLHLRSTNRIPHGRGLGSSSAAICAGVLLGRALVPGADERMGLDDVLAFASGIEGHPDNVAACVLGGLTIAWTDAGAAAPTGPTARAVSLAPVPQLCPVVFVPPFASSTARTRQLLPAQVSHSDAAFSVARAALLVAALTQCSDVLLAATEDRLHQPYRAPAMPASAELVERLRDRGLPAVISGAGPTVLALTASPAAAGAALELAPGGWRATQVAVDPIGAEVLEPATEY